jgi:3-methyladenine DNA glycosylase AlkD
MFAETILLESMIEAASNPERAVGMAKYMRDKFSFMGIASQQRREISKAYWKANPLPSDRALAKEIMTEMWEHPVREINYCVLDVIERWVKPDDIEWLEQLIVTRSWWDSVDALHKTVGKIFLQAPALREAWIKKWLDSGNVWLQRMTLIFQLSYGDKTDERLLFQQCKALASHPDFFIRKGIGWALRQHARKNPESVRTFVAQHTFSPLSVREALKHLA